MAKSLSKKVKKRVRKGAKAIEKSMKNLRADEGRSTGKLVGAAVAGVAGVVGIAAAIQHLRKGKNGKVTLHVRTEGDHWVLVAEGGDEPLDSFRTKEEAVEAARDAAAQAAPSVLVIHRLDGSVMKTHSYAPA